MGLLDMFGGGDDPQTQGLLAAAAGILNASGPSLAPRGLGQIFGAGLSGYQQAQSQGQEQAIKALQLKGLQSDLDQRQAAQDMQNRIRARLTPAAGVADTQPSQPQMPQSMGSMPTIMQPQESSLPDWMQATSGSGVQAAPPPQSAPAPVNLTQQLISRLSNEAQVRAQEGDSDGANKLYEQIQKLQPKYSTDFRKAIGADGQLHNYQLADDGSQKDTGLGVAPELTEVDLGGTKQFVDKNGIAPGTSFARTMTPSEIANNAISRGQLSVSQQRLAFDKSQADKNQDAALDPLAVHLAAQQYLAGDSGALQNYGRGAQGAQNLNQIRAEIAKQATANGMTGADIAAKMAEFAGTKAGQRTAGTRSANIEIAANEAGQFAPIALAASEKVARSGLLPFGKAQVMFDSNTNDPNLRQFAMANQALVNAYGQVISRGGVATDSDKKHAQELLSTAMDQKSYSAAVDQLMQEVTAARKAPQAVRSAISAGVSGRGDASTSPAAAPAPQAATSKVATLSDIAATARASGRSTAEVTAALRAKGYTIGGQ